MFMFAVSYKVLLIDIFISINHKAFIITWLIASHLTVSDWLTTRRPTLYCTSSLI